jgi:hypothetical protein
MNDINDALKSSGIDLESFQKIKLGQGVVGKTTSIFIAICFVCGVIAWKLSVQWMLFSLFVGLLAAFFTYVWWASKFAKENPSLAVLDGAEMIRWRQLDMAAKGYVDGVPSDPVQNDGQISLSAPGNVLELEQ